MNTEQSHPTPFTKIFTIGGLILGGFLVLVGIGIYWTSSISNPQPNTTQETENTQNAASAEVQGLLPDILKLGIDFSCSFETVDPSVGTTSGKIYIAENANLIRGTVNSIAAEDNMVQVSNFIRSEDMGYFWVEGESQGLQFPISSEQDLFAAPAVAESENTQESEMISPDFSDLQQADFSCLPWIKDDTMFTPPSSVEFSDFSALFGAAFQKNAGASSEGSSIQGTEFQADCSLCDAVPEETAKAQCLAALGCQ